MSKKDRKYCPHSARNIFDEMSENQRTATNKCTRVFDGRDKHKIKIMRWLNILLLQVDIFCYWDDASSTGIRQKENIVITACTW